MQILEARKSVEYRTQKEVEMLMEEPALMTEAEDDGDLEMYRPMSYSAAEEIHAAGSKS